MVGGKTSFSIVFSSQSISVADLTLSTPDCTNPVLEKLVNQVFTQKQIQDK